MAGTISALRSLCERCDTRDSSKLIKGQRFPVRELSVEQSVAARYGIIESSQMIQNGLMRVVPDAIDGKKFIWSELLPGIVQSRATGGIGKRECGFDPQELRMKRLEKSQETERMYVHRELCMLEYIGSVVNGGEDGHPVYIRNNDNLFTAAQANQMSIDVLVNDMRSMAVAVDGTAVLGNWTGDGGGALVNGAASKFPHFDGILKQASLQAGNTYYSTFDVTLTALSGGDGYFIRYNGNIGGVYATPAAVVAGINALKIDVTEEFPFSAVLAAPQVIRIVSNDPEKEAYGQYGIEVFYSDDATLERCDKHLDGVEVEVPMPYAEQPLIFDKVAITNSNWYQYFIDVNRAFERHLITLYDGRNAPENLGERYIACDPLILADKDYAKLNEMCGCENALEKIGLMDSKFPNMVGLDVLKGSGLWFMTYPGNVVYLTNTDADALGTMKTWYDEDCDKVKGKVEMLGNVLVGDYSLVASNIGGSSFEAGLGEPYKPADLPHLAAEIRANAVSDSRSEGGFEVFADICWAANGADFDITMSDDSVIPSGDSIASAIWKAVKNDGTELAPGVQAESVVLTILAADYADVIWYTLKVTTTKGLVKFVTIPKEEVSGC